MSNGSASKSPDGSKGVRLEALVHAMPTLISERHLDTVLQRVAELAAGTIGARYAAVGMLAQDGQTLATFTTTGLTDVQREAIGPLPQGHGILGLVIRRGESIRLADLREHPASYGFPPNHPPMGSFLGVPITGKRGVLGDLYLTEKLGGGEFSEEDERIAQLLAAQAGAAIENAQLHEESAQLLEEVQQLHRSRERFFAMINHELRNALAAVFGWAEMLVRRKDPKSVPRAAYEVLDSAEQAIGLINDLLDLSRLDEDRLKPVLKVVDCAAAIDNAFHRLTPSAETKGVRLVKKLATRVLCHSDPHRVEQILVNVLSNAVRHTPDATSVVVTVGSEPPDVTFTIEDEGPGVMAGEVERIFDLYQTKTGTEAGKGAGLGLPLSRRLARLLGGDLVAISRDGGGRFILRLPAASV